MVYDNKKHHIPNPTVYGNIFGGWGKITKVGDDILNLVPTGSAIDTHGQLVKSRDQAAVYLVQNG